VNRPADWRIVLGSRSPRRRELLGRLVPESRLEIWPPREAEEAGFEGLTELPQIQTRLLEIATTKWHDVQQQIDHPDRSRTWLLTADTMVVVPRSGRIEEQAADGWQVLGQPPTGDEAIPVLRDWFLNHYAGRRHRVMTGYCFSRSSATTPEIRQVGVTEVEMRPDLEQWFDWYIQTGEFVGKAGGYALQGAGELLVNSVSGSLSNVIGLPLALLADDLRREGLMEHPARSFGTGVP